MARRAKQKASVASSRQKNQDLLVAISAESDEESARLKTYVAARGWRFADREYRPAEWCGILEDARKRRFNAVSPASMGCGGLRKLPLRRTSKALRVSIRRGGQPRRQHRLRLPTKPFSQTR